MSRCMKRCHESLICGRSICVAVPYVSVVYIAFTGFKMYFCSSGFVLGFGYIYIGGVPDLLFEHCALIYKSQAGNRYCCYF